MLDFPNFIAGAFENGRGASFANHFPSTGEEIGVVYSANQEQVDKAVGAARDALSGKWGAMPLAERVPLLRRVSAGITARFDEFLAAEIRDTGKPRSIAAHIDIPRGAANFDFFADQITTASTETFEMNTPDGATALNYTIRRPRGVIAVICPWNLPLLLMTWKVAPALACGNTVVVKPSEETPATAKLLGEVMNEAGVPPGVFNVVYGKGPGDTGEFLTSHPDIDGITFTGETRTGEAIMQKAAKGVRPVSLELGGKNAGIIFADSDIDQVLEGIGRACFANTGQVCLGTERLYVERPIFDQVAERLAKQARSYRFGDPFDAATTMGPVISDTHRDKVLSYFDRAKAGGATILSGGSAPAVAGYEQGYWVEPTVWAGLPESDPVVADEIFGPCTHLCPFDSEDEAVNLANASPYGLATSIWTTNLGRAHRVARDVEVGISWVNCWFLRDLRTAFGGSKASGIGREGGLHSLEFYSELRNVCIKY